MQCVCVCEHGQLCTYIFLTFLTFRRRIRVRVAVLAETFPSFSVSGPFFLDVPGFQVPSDSIVPPQLWSSSRALPLHLLFCNCSDFSATARMFSVSPLLLTRLNQSILLRLITVAIVSTLLLPRSPHFSGVLTGSPPLPIAPLSSLLLPYTFHLWLTLAIFSHP